MIQILCLWKSNEGEVGFGHAELKAEVEKQTTEARKHENAYQEQQFGWSIGCGERNSLK